MIAQLSLSGCSKFESARQFLFGAPQEQAKPINEQGLETTNPVYILTPKERLAIQKTFLSEIYEQVFARKFSDKEEYARWINVLGQGASVEGVYRGLVLSTNYAQLEQGKTTSKALDFFVSEMVQLLFSRAGKSVTNISAPAMVEKEEKLRAEILTAYEQRSLFTLKRVLGEEVLAYIETIKNDRNELAKWYAETTVRWNQLGVDFGIKQRNSTDKIYLEQWARSNSLGRIQWETLYRLHRLFNNLGNILYGK